MIQITNLTKSYGSQELFSEANFVIGSREKVGLVGRNGHGKSTLLRILAGKENPDGGNITFPEAYRLASVDQHVRFSEPSVLKEATAVLPQRDGGWKEEHVVEEILAGLGFSQAQFKTSPDKLSGGYQVRLMLAKALASDPQLLLLDEPTNYLDILAVRWLTRFLSNWAHELVIVSHDRGFMDAVVTHIIGIHRKRIRKLRGHTSHYYEQIVQEEEIHEKTRQNQQKRIDEAKTYINRFRAKARQAKNVQSKIKALDRMENLDKLDQLSSLNFRFNSLPFTARWVLSAENLSFGFTPSKLLFKNLNFSLKNRERLAIVGQNGTGKTTLLRLLAGELSAGAGKLSVSNGIELGYFGQTNVERLNPEQTVEEAIYSSNPELGRTVVRGICGAMLFEGDAALKSISVLSGGEKSRVLLGQIIASQINLLFLDEPSNHLDMDANDALMEAVEDFSGAVIMVTHSEMMLRRLANRLIVFRNGNAEVFEGSYDEFIEGGGWGDEVKEVTNIDSSRDSKKERRRKRAELISQRNEKLKPLENRIKELEAELTTLEQATSKQSERLIEITKDGYGDEAAKLSRELHRSRSKNEELYAELATITEEFEKASEQYAAKLEDLND